LKCDDQEGLRSRNEEEQEDKHYSEPALGFLKCTPLNKTVKIIPLYLHHIGMHNGQNIFNLEVVLCHEQCKVLTEQQPNADLRNLVFWHMKLASMGTKFSLF